jgi:hypothetical protein
MASNRKPNWVLTNRDLGRLLTSLGFQSSNTTSKFHRAWQHAEAGTLIILPANKEDERALEVNLHSVRTHLDYNGHMEAKDFDEFVKTGKIAIS